MTLVCVIVTENRARDCISGSREANTHCGYACILSGVGEYFHFEEEEPPSALQ